MKTLNISKEISLPISAVTETFAAIGRRGAGKSYLATMIAEQMLDAGAQVVVIDPVGIWWGLRVGADGKSKGKEIFVVGGEHGDVPIVPEAGKKIAQLIVEKGVSVVIDVSGFRMGEHKRFAAEFAEEFFHLKKTKKTPIHIFVEEAQTIIPQRVGPDEARMVGAFERIVRLGRNYGIGCTLITQRPQSVNKEVLSQIEILCVLQITGLHERKALEGWVQEHDADRKLIGELPSLARGEGYVWSPSFLKIFKRVNFSKKNTFDASATPIVGKETKAASTSSVDVEKLRKDMAEVIQKAEQDDPAALKRKIKELQNTKGPKTVVDEKSIERAVEQAVRQRDNSFNNERRSMQGTIDELTKKLNQIGKIVGTESVIYTSSAKITPDIAKAMKPGAVIQLPKEKISSQSPGEVSKPQQKVLDAISWLNAIGVDTPSKEAVALVAGYRPTSGGYMNICGMLRSAGLISYPTPGIFALTEEGSRQANHEDIGSQEDLHSKIQGVLSAPEWKVLAPLIAAYPNELHHDELAEQAGYQATSGGYMNLKGKLRTLGLINYTKPGYSRAADILFIQ